MIDKFMDTNISDTPETDAMLPLSTNWYYPDSAEYLEQRKFAQTLERDRNKYKTAIVDCIDWANGRQYEWGERSENAFQFLEIALGIGSMQ